MSTDKKTAAGAADALIALVEERGLGVGDRLPPELELSRTLGFSRSKIREILTTWESNGLVVRNKGAGTSITAEISSNAMHLPLTVKIEADSLLRMLAVRRPLEVESSRLAARLANDDQRRIIQARSAELQAVYAAGEDWRPADHRFHEAIQDATGNPLFAQIIAQIQKGFSDIYDAPLGRPALGQDSIPAHSGLADAVITGDEQRAGDITREILDGVIKEAREIIGEKND